MKSPRGSWILALFLAIGFASPAHALTIDITYTHSVQNLSYFSSVENAVNYVVTGIENRFSNPVTLHIQVGDMSGGLGESETSLLNIPGANTYSGVQTALINNATTPNELFSVGPSGSVGSATDPTGGGSFDIPRAEAQALGIDPGDNASDGEFLFATNVTYSFNTNQRAIGGDYDFIGIAQHEITEIMGRIPGLNTNGYYLPYDLFRFTSPGTHSVSINNSGVYFSIDNGNTNLKNYNFPNGNGSDPQDWASGVNDSFNAFGSSDSADIVTPVDYTTMDVIGYHLTAGPTFTWTGTSLDAPLGSWTMPGNWSAAGGPPDLAGATAQFAATSPTGTVTLDGPQTIGFLQLQNGAVGSGLTIAPGSGGTLTFDNGASAATITVSAGQHTISAPVYLNSPLSISVTTIAAGTGLTISGSIANGPSGLGNSLSLSGGGLLSLSGSNSFTGGVTITGGTLNINADAALGTPPGAPTTNITFSGSGTLQFNPGYSGTSLSTSRSISIGSSDAGTIDTDGNSLITYAGLLTAGGSATFGKTGAGVFELDAPPNLGANASLLVTGGTLRLKYASAATIGSSASVAVSNSATLELAGGGVSQLSQGVNIANNSTAAAGLLVSSSFNQDVGTVTGSGNTVVNSGASLTAYQIRQNSLSINGNGVVTLRPSGSGSTTNPAAPNNINFSSTVASLSIGGTLNGWTGTLDIGNNGLVIAYGSGSDPFTTVENMVQSGYSGGLWNGTGITSSLARAAEQLGSPTPQLNIGLEDFTPGAGNYSNTTFIAFEGQTIATNAVLLRLTYMDDLVLAGDLSANDSTSDAFLFAANYGIGTTWSVGDLNHDGQIDSSDALAFAANFMPGLPSLDGSTGNAVVLGGDSPAVPEPSGLALAGAGAAGLGLLVRRRGRSEVAASRSVPFVQSPS